MIEKWNILEKNEKNPQYRGWFMGNFLEKNDFLHSENVECKFHEYKKWEMHIGSTTVKSRKTICILLEGKVEFSFGEKKFFLSEKMDYIADDEIPGEHSVVALESSKLLIIRYFL